MNVKIKSNQSPLNPILRSLKNYRAGEVAVVLNSFIRNNQTIVNVMFADGLQCAFNESSLTAA